MNLPKHLDPLKALPNWVCWRLEKAKNGKPTKVPYQTNGVKAATNTPSTWATYDVVTHGVNGFDGIGIVVGGTTIAAFDLDDCRDPATGSVHPWAQALVKKTNSYAEITPSGTGLRILGYGEGAEVHRKLKVPNAGAVTCEIYRQATRYITVTGNVYADKPLVNIDSDIDAVLAELDQKDQKAKKQGPKGSSKADKPLPAALSHMLHLTGDTPATYQTRSELLWAFLSEALRRGIDENAIVAACLDATYTGKSIHTHVKDNGGESYVKRQIEKAINQEGDESTDKTIIRIETGKLDTVWRATERALIRKHCPVYVRGGKLVQPLWRWERSGEKNRDVLVSGFVELNMERLRDIVGHHAALFQKWDTRQKGWKNIDPPKEVIETLLAVKHWDFDSVVGIVNSPTMRPDGSLLTTPGYDSATQLWYKPAGDVELPPIPERPTREQALAAKQLFVDLLKGFPLVTELDKSVAVAMILTTVLRGAFEIAPLFFILAPESGTGKSYLVAVISIIATGRISAATVASPKPEEMEKRLAAASFKATPILHLNNLDFNLESAMLCQMVTEGTIEIRELGKSANLNIDCRATTVIVNGNNIRMVGDLVRRTLTARMDAKMEQPESREFAFDPVELVKTDRGKYLAAAFTIVRAYMAAGSPKQAVKNFAGFKDWCRFVRDPLLWLGMADPVESMEETRTKDPERIALAERISCLAGCFGNAPFTAAEVHGKATMGYSELFAVFSRDGKNISAKSIGNQLMRDIGRVSGERHIELVKADARTSNSYHVVGAAWDLL